MASTILYKGRSQEFSEFSNLYRCQISWEGVSYSSLEQLYKTLKAWAVGAPKDVCDQIAQTADPFTLVQMVKLKWDDPNQEKWEKLEFAVMVGCMVQKFTQNPHLKEKLLATGDAYLVEDTPNQKWGRGKDGRGLNLQGRALMEVRNMLACQQCNRPYQSQLKYLILGDSMLKHLNPINKTQNLSWPGGFISTVKLFLPLLVSIPSVEKIVCLVGTNDLSRHISRGRPEKEVWQRLKKVIDAARCLALREDGTARCQIQLVSVLQRFCDIKLGGGERQFSPVANSVVVFNSKARRYVEAVGQPDLVVYIDAHQYLDHPSYFGRDQLHLSREGNERMDHIIKYSLSHSFSDPVLATIPGITK